MARARPKETPDVAEQLRRAVAGCGRSLNQLARETGVHQAQLSRFLRKERSLTLTAAAKLCAHLGLYLAGPALDKKE
jgi:antitoxin component HigA of HigAB toxin-antitoxin module